jgi:hypothetical protein
MKILILLVAVALTGCGTNGEPLLLARFYDAQDPCQLQNIRGATIDDKIKNMPSWCGVSSGRKYIYNNQGARVGYTKN